MTGLFTNPDMIVPTLQAASADGGLRTNSRDNALIGREDVTELLEAFWHSGLVYRGGEMWDGPWMLTRAGRVLLTALLADPSLIEADGVLP